MNFFSKVEELAKKKNTLLCVGIDPRVTVENGADPYPVLVETAKKLIEQTAQYAVAFKPNSAFFECHGPRGMEALKDVIKLIPEDCVIILDAKRGDIGPTAEAYAKAAFDIYNADCITIAPYMGKDAATPFLAYEGKGIFVMGKNSNPSANDLQLLQVADVSEDPQPLYLKNAEIATSWSDQVGLVVAGNDYESMGAMRAKFPNAWFLSPGIGAQGGKMEDAMAAGMRADGMGIMPVVVRAIANADDPAQAAKEYRDALNAARTSAAADKAGSPIDPLKRRVFEGLIKNECFRAGSFVLKSGLTSPFYIDLRRTSSDPKLLKDIAKAYATLIKELKYDRIAGIPVAAMPLATAVSLEANIPMIYPRMTMKAHGTGNQIEGNYKEGERVLLLDDLITTGKSKLEAIEILRGAGLIVEDLIVLLERGRQGRRDMEAAGVNLYSYADVQELFPVCHDMGVVDDEKLAEMKAFVEGDR